MNTTEWKRKQNDQYLTIFPVCVHVFLFLYFHLYSFALCCTPASTECHCLLRTIKNLTFVHAAFVSACKLNFSGLTCIVKNMLRQILCTHASSHALAHNNNNAYFDQTNSFIYFVLLLLCILEAVHCFSCFLNGGHKLSFSIWLFVRLIFHSMLVSSGPMARISIACEATWKNCTDKVKQGVSVGMWQESSKSQWYIKTNICSFDRVAFAIVKNGEFWQSWKISKEFHTYMTVLRCAWFGSFSAMGFEGLTCMFPILVAIRIVETRYSNVYRMIGEYNVSSNWCTWNTLK